VKLKSPLDKKLHLPKVYIMVVIKEDSTKNNTDMVYTLSNLKVKLKSPPDKKLLMLKAYIMVVIKEDSTKNNLV
jgi:hypothetical protein